MKALLLLSALTAALMAVNTSCAQQHSLNVVVILMKDMEYNNPGAFDAIHYKTLNLDNLTVNRMRFTNLYIFHVGCSIREPFC